MAPLLLTIANSCKKILCFMFKAPSAGWLTRFIENTEDIKSSPSQFSLCFSVEDKWYIPSVGVYMYVYLSICVYIFNSKSVSVERSVLKMMKRSWKNVAYEGLNWNLLSTRMILLLHNGMQLEDFLFAEMLT